MADSDGGFDSDSDSSSRPSAKSTSAKSGLVPNSPAAAEEFREFSFNCNPEAGPGSEASDGDSSEVFDPTAEDLEETPKSTSKRQSTTQRFSVGRKGSSVGQHPQKQTRTNTPPGATVQDALSWNINDANWKNVAEVTKMGILSAHKKIAKAKEESAENKSTIHQLRTQIRGMQQRHVEEKETLKHQMSALENFSKKRGRRPQAKKSLVGGSSEGSPERGGLRRSALSNAPATGQGASPVTFAAGTAYKRSSQGVGSPANRRKSIFGAVPQAVGKAKAAPGQDAGDPESDSGSDSSEHRGMTEEERQKLAQIVPMERRLGETQTSVGSLKQRMDAMQKRIDKLMLIQDSMEVRMIGINNELGTDTLHAMVKKVLLQEMPVLFDRLNDKETQATHELLENHEARINEDMDGVKLHTQELQATSESAIVRIQEIEAHLLRTMDSASSSSGTSSEEESEVPSISPLSRRNSAASSRRHSRRGSLDQVPEEASRAGTAEDEDAPAGGQTVPASSSSSFAPSTSPSLGVDGHASPAGHPRQDLHGQTSNHDRGHDEHKQNDQQHSENGRSDHGRIGHDDMEHGDTGIHQSGHGQSEHGHSGHGNREHGEIGDLVNKRHNVQKLIDKAQLSGIEHSHGHTAEREAPVSSSSKLQTSHEDNSRSPHLHEQVKAVETIKGPPSELAPPAKPGAAASMWKGLKNLRKAEDLDPASPSSPRNQGAVKLEEEKDGPKSPWSSVAKMVSGNNIQSPKGDGLDLASLAKSWKAKKAAKQKQQKMELAALEALALSMKEKRSSHSQGGAPKESESRRSSRASILNPNSAPGAKFVEFESRLDQCDDHFEQLESLMSGLIAKVDALTSATGSLREELGVTKDDTQFAMKRISSTQEDLQSLQEKFQDNIRQLDADVNDKLQNFVKEAIAERKRLADQLAVLFPRLNAVAGHKQPEHQTVSDARLFALDVRLDSLEDFVSDSVAKLRERRRTSQSPEAFSPETESPRSPRAWRRAKMDPAIGDSSRSASPLRTFQNDSLESVEDVIRRGMWRPSNSKRASAQTRRSTDNSPRRSIPETASGESSPIRPASPGKASGRLQQLLFEQKEQILANSEEVLGSQNSRSISPPPRNLGDTLPEMQATLTSLRDQAEAMPDSNMSVLGGLPMHVAEGAHTQVPPPRPVSAKWTPVRSQGQPSAILPLRPSRPNTARQNRKSL